MANSGCQDDAAGTEKLFVKNFAGYDHIVTPSGSCAHHVREHMTAIPQNATVQKVRRSTHELVEFLHDVLQVREFPWAEFPHKVGLHIGCATLRGLRDAKMSEISGAPFSKPHELLSKVKGIQVRRAEAHGRVLRLRRNVLGVRGARFREDGAGQGQRPQKGGAEYIVSPTCPA